MALAAHTKKGTPMPIKQTVSTPLTIRGNRASLVVYALVLIAAFVAGQVVLYFAPHFSVGKALFKVVCGMVPVLIAASATRINPCAKYRVMLMSLVFCLVGDVAINFAGVIGIAAFALAHVGLVIAFLIDGGVRARHLIVSGALAAVGLALLFANASVAGELLIPCAVYIVIISTMVGTSLSEPRLIMIGAITFVLSDMLLGVKHIMGTTPVFSAIVLGIYYVAVFLLAAGMLLHGASPDDQPHRSVARYIGRVLMALVLGAVVLLVVSMATILVWRGAERAADVTKIDYAPVALASEASGSPAHAGPFTASVDFEGFLGAAAPFTLDVTWDDDWFFEDPTVYNHGLAQAAAALSAATYEETGYYDGVLDRAVLDEMLAALGFEWMQTSSYQYRTTLVDHAYAIMTGEDDIVEYSIATKRIVSSATGERRNLICVAIRGTRFAEWLSNMNFADSSDSVGDHLGFARASQDIEDDISEIVARDPDATWSLLVCGHSRGAGVSDILVSDLDLLAMIIQNVGVESFAEDMIDSEELADAEKEDYELFATETRAASTWNIYCYTFAAPNASSYDMASESEFDNIFNIVNPADIVTRLPLESWGYRRYGNDVMLPSPATPGYAELLDKVANAYEDIAHKKCEVRYDDAEVLDALIASFDEMFPTSEDALAPAGIFRLVVAVLGDFGLPRIKANHHELTYLAWMQVLTEEQALAGLVEKGLATEP